MEILKAHWLNDGDKVRLVMPFNKVDTEHRLVSGFASLNNLDKHDDVVTAEASTAAFSMFRGNIREMHQPIAAGRMVSFSQEPYYDTETGTTYEGIYVTAYVSKGAQETWEKVLDGTLSGFSIGGIVKNQHSEYIPDLGKSIRFITGLELFELSLVDNPANQLANVLSIHKVDGELVAKGMATEVETQNVFWCETDRSARATSDESASCIQCSADMENIGWIEVTDSVAATAELKKFVDDWTTKVITAQQIKEQLGRGTVQQQPQFATEENFGDNNTDNAVKSEGGVDMSDVETVEKAAEVDEVVETAPVEEVEKSVEAETVEEAVEKTVDEVVEDNAVEKSADEEVVAEEPVVEKANDAATVDFDGLTKAVAEIATSLAALAETVAETKKSVENIASVSEKIDETNSAIKNVGSRLDNLEKATATKKSGDDDSSEPVHKGFSWGGHFASANSIVS